MLKPSRARGTRQKVLGLDELAALLERLRANGRTVVHCHGVFDLVHVGHIRHLQEASRHGDVLVVTITPDSFVNKGPNRPAFSEQLRAEALAALDCVDYVAINKWATAVETIRLLKPSSYVKGPDYRDAQADRTGGIAREEAAVREVGGRLVITDDITFSSSTLLNRHFSGYPAETQEYLESFRDRHTASEVTDYVNGCSKLKVLAVGEAIIDEYQYCTAIGKSSKEPTLAVRLEAEDRFAGGVLAVANHLANFAGKVGVLTVTGGEPPVNEFISKALNGSVEAAFFQRQGVPTLVKRRLVERYFFHKLLEIYEMEDRAPTPTEDAAFRERIEAVLPTYDVVLMSDFGHGMISPGVIEDVTRGARFLAVNTQTNAGNAGYNLISKYHRADYVSITEGELRLDARDRDAEYGGLMRDTARRLGSRLMAVTRGKAGCAVYDRGGTLAVAPAVATQVIDRIGAGDAFLSVTSLCAAQGAPADVVAFIGNVVGAEAVKTVGNSKAVDKLAVIRGIESLMK